MRLSTLLLIVFYQFSFAQVIDHSNDLLWEVRAPNGKTSYLFGSLHSNVKKVFRFSDSTFIALRQAEMIALELDVTELYTAPERQAHSLTLNFDNEGEPYTNSTEASKTSYGDENGMPQFLDAYFQQYADNSGKPIFALETLAAQKAILNGATVGEVSEYRIEQFLTTGDKMLDLYVKGDIYRLHDLMKNSLSLYNNLYEELIIERNKKMVEMLDAILPSKRIFCAVGAGHLAGKDGLVQLLRSKGYKVRKVLASYSEEPTAAAVEVRGARNYIYTNDTLGIKMVFGGKPIVVKDPLSDALLHLRFEELGQGNSYTVEVYERTFETGLQQLAERFIASPPESPAKEIHLPNGGEAVEGLADTYQEGYSWTRILLTEEVFVVLKAYGGNKFMNSTRPFRFFDQFEFF